ncbi:MAG: aminotransferase class IV [Bryobacterales bacterium]|nr:aminotransferase class IV [Bryobacterales bacterium]
MLHRFILHNGRIREAGEAVLSPGQVGLLSGWGIFTTLRVSEGVLFAYERHWARMHRDALLMRVPMPDDPEEVRRQLLQLVEANQAYDSTMRVAVVRNLGGMWQEPGLQRSFDLIALTAGLKDWGGGVKLRYVPQARHAASIFAGAKILSWAMNLTWLEEAQCEGFDEVILLNERGEVAECTSANIFCASGGRIWTPPLASGCLPGVTRELLLSEIAVPGFEVGERTLFPADLEQAEEVFITSTTRDLLPVERIGSKPVGAGSHRVREAAQAAFSAYSRAYVNAHKESPVRTG